MKIFLLEDDRTMRQKIAKAFENEGCAIVAQAGNTSKESFEEAIKSKADLFVLDIQLENNKSGFEFAKKLYEIDRGVQIIYLSEMEEYHKESFSLSNHPVPLDFISKNDLNLIGMDKYIWQFVTRFKANQPIKVRIAGQTVLAEDVMFAQINKDKEAKIIEVYIKDGRVLEKFANLKDLIDSSKEDYIPTLVSANKDLLVNEKQIQNSVRENKKEEPATLFFKTQNGIEYQKKTGKKRGVEFHKKHK